MAGYWHQFWNGQLVSGRRLAIFRFLFFGLLCVDAIKLLPRAARYGADGFFLSHFPLLDSILPAPGRIAMLVLYTLAAYVAGRIAFNAPRPWRVGLLCAVYGAAYFSSQLDSYQHHYLLILLLGISIFIPWRNPEKQSQWAVRLLLLQVSAVYVWAAIAKLEPLWLDGTTLKNALTEPWMYELIDEKIGWKVASVGILVTELLLAVLIQVRRFAIPAVCIGVAMHLSIELSNFKIDLFSYYMFAIYGLLLPVPRGLATRVNALIDSVTEKIRPRSPAILLVSALLASVLLARSPFEGTIVVAICLSLVLCVEYYKDRDNPRQLNRHLLGHSLTILLMFICSQWAHVARDHYRFLGGSARRFGNIEKAEWAYKRVVEIEPSYGIGYSRLGDLKRLQDPTGALILYKRAIKASPEHSSGYSGAAKVYYMQGRKELARTTAKQALERDPADKSSILILEKLKARR